MCGVLPLHTPGARLCWRAGQLLGMGCFQILGLVLVCAGVGLACLRGVGVGDASVFSCLWRPACSSVVACSACCEGMHAAFPSAPKLACIHSVYDGQLLAL